MEKIEMVSVCFKCRTVYTDVGEASITTPCPNCLSGMDFMTSEVLVSVIEWEKANES